MVSQKIMETKKYLLQKTELFENKNDAQSMREFLEEEFAVLAEKLDFLNTFTADEKKILIENDWRLDEHDLGTAHIDGYLKSESIVKDDGMYLYSLFDEQKGDLVHESMPFVYLENLLNYQAGNTGLEFIED